jgi:probable rRNA maturation factor
VSRAEAERLARAVLRAERVRDATLSVTLVGRRRIRSLNHRYLAKDRETDVIAFGLRDARGPIVGDVYVCVPVATTQAVRYGTTPQDEIRRLVIHGVLHVLGYDHSEGARRTTGAMWRRQEQLLARWGGAR